MGKVVDLATERLLRGIHRTGVARCMGCKHEWAATAPVGTTDLECPSCGTLLGVYKATSVTEFKQWQCQCGEFMFHIDERGAYCAYCGTRPEHLQR